MDVADFLISDSLTTGDVSRNGYPPVITVTHLIEAGLVAVLALLVTGIIAYVRTAMHRRRAPVLAAPSTL